MAPARTSFDLVVLDIMMPGMDGYEVCRRIRQTSDVPVLFLSAKNEELDQVRGFAIGADDYVTKPFKARELVARIKARVRRDRRANAAAQPREILSSAGLELDVSAHEATLNGEPVSLTPTEFGLLVELMRAGDAPVSAQELYESVWHEVYNASSRNSVMVYIRHLRKKLEQIDSSRPFIDTVWGVGYRMRQAATRGSDLPSRGKSCGRTAATSRRTARRALPPSCFRCPRPPRTRRRRSRTRGDPSRGMGYTILH